MGTEIRLLREQRGMSGKDLAAAIELSQSQISRLEAGLRRVDTTLLPKLAEALSVSITHFFPKLAPQTPTALPARRESGSHTASKPIALDGAADPIDHVGKIIRRERRNRHITADSLARSVSKGTSWVRELEGGATELLSGEMLQRVAKALKIAPKLLYDAQRNQIRYLQQRIGAMEQAYANRTRGQLELGDSRPRSGVPMLGHVGDRLNLGPDGVPSADVLDYLYLPQGPDSDFALTHKGEEMISKASPSFDEGDFLVFSIEKEVRHRDYALVVTDLDAWLFRQVFFDPRGVVRLQPLNMDYAPQLCHRDEVKRLFCLTARVQKL
ncbi:MAG: helix-turn-helix domain-containing protein [Planctomycetota bacterium]|nr:helix-turn-helix domain-containing protein [Planctomycetota bacterium]